LGWELDACQTAFHAVLDAGDLQREVRKFVGMIFIKIHWCIAVSPQPDCRVGHILKRL
jgi:hypothetical protein